MMDANRRTWWPEIKCTHELVGHFRKTAPHKFEEVRACVVRAICIPVVTENGVREAYIDKKAVDDYLLTEDIVNSITE